MITKDQPTCFPADVQVKVSSRSDGTMLNRSVDTHNQSIVSNRSKFCDKIGVNYDNVVYQRIVYGENRSYDLICEVDDGSTSKNTAEVVADALFTRVTGVGLMLPIADCVATVIYDPGQRFLSLLHLGRHSTLTPLLSRVIDKFIHEGSRAEDLIVWMSPNALASSYVMKYFDRADDPDWADYHYRSNRGIHLDLQGYSANTCLQKGIKSTNIHTSEVDTVTSNDYFSHSAGDKTGRFAVVAMMR